MMNKKLIAIAIGAALGAGPLTAQARSDIKVSWFGFTQITASYGELDFGNSNDGLRFGADRIRIGYKMKVGNAFGKLQVDFNRSNIANTTPLPEIIKDAEVGYKWSSAARVKAGIFKTPVGMDFNTSGKKLDITKRGMEKALVLERAVGVMLSGRKIGGGFGYDIGVFNPTVRSTVVSGGTTGTDSAWAARFMYDMGKMFHAEVYYGQSESAGGGTTADYEVWGLAAKWRSGPLTAKFEYISGSDLMGNAGLDQTVWYVHGGWRLNRQTELVIRHYQGERDGIPSGWTVSGASSADLRNTYVGVNFFLGPKDHNARIQLNYVFVGGDEATWYQSWNSSSTTAGRGGSARGYTEDGFLVQFQTSF